MSLPGPSRTIEVEPIEQPAQPERIPEPSEAPAEPEPERVETPEPVPEKVPV